MGQTATFTQVGLNRDDGIPAEYRGEITWLAAGHNDLYAMVDSSLVTGTGTSTLMAYDDTGWRCLFLAATPDDVMCGGIVSSASSKYRLYFDHDNKLYYIDLSRDVRNPLKLATSAFAAAGSHITPWFDAGTAVFDKAAIKMTVFADNITSTETVIVSYRLNHTYTNIASGWTAFTTIDDTTTGISGGQGVVEFPFGSSKGIEFNAIQFKFDLARGDTTTLSPDIQATFSYRQGKPIWAWTVTANCAEEYNDLTPRELVAALKTAANSLTLLEFTFRNAPTGTETHYVSVSPFNGITQTGENYTGRYNLTLVEP